MTTGTDARAADTSGSAIGGESTVPPDPTERIGLLLRDLRSAAPG
ncbi:hypothetical protein [Nocardia sp. NPDC051981]